MSSNTSIEWTDKTWNPVRGCSVISPGCVNCYAMKQAHRFSGEGKPFAGLTKATKAGPQWTGVIRTVEDALLEPLSWRKPQRVFVNSMSDLFHEDVPFEFIDKVFAVMGLAPQHTFQILTKRADRLRAYMAGTAYGRVRKLMDGDDGGDHPDLRFPSAFVEMFCNTHRLPTLYVGDAVSDSGRRCLPGDDVTRIEFEYTEPLA